MKMKIFGFTTAIIFTMLISCCIRINITPDDDNYTKKISSGGTTVNIKKGEAGPMADSTIHIKGNYTELFANYDMQIIMDAQTDNVIVKCEADVMPYIDIHQKGNRLFVTYKPKSKINKHERTQVLIPFQELESVELEGSADLHIHTPLTSRTFEADLSGSSLLACKIENPSAIVEIEANGASHFLFDGEIRSLDLDFSGAVHGIISPITVQNIEADLSGSSTLSISGKARRLEADLSGAAALMGTNLLTQIGDVELSGASNMDINCVEWLTAELSGASTLNCVQRPKIANISKGIACDVNGN